MSTPQEPVGPGLSGHWKRPAQVLLVSSVMFTFISYWRTAAVVLCDLGSTAYYIGGIVEQSIGKAAPWFILAVMLFSFCVRWVYIESCTLFVRGGVYRVVREALGRFMAKFAVSALMFDYVLTGPISGVSAGQYIVGLLLETLKLIDPSLRPTPEAAEQIKSWGSVLIATLITLYFFRLNVIGIHESSDKALKIMAATTVMGIIMLTWCGLTLAVKGPVNDVPIQPDLSKKIQYEVDPDGVDRVTHEKREQWKRNPETSALVPQLDENGQTVPKINRLTGGQEDPLGFLGHLLPDSWQATLRAPAALLSLVGVFGLLLAFSHSILAMSGEETLAQVYREVEAPKLQNFKRAAFIVFIYSLLLTGTISFMAVALIPDEVRMKDYDSNLIGGLAMYVWGHPIARLLLNAFVVVVGFLILAGAVNTSIIGSNGVLNRVAEDGVLSDWFLRPHPRYGTTYRILYMILGLQLTTILVSRGDMLLLGEAYAFGVVWSFVFQAVAMLVLRFRDTRPREFKVPLNIRLGGREIPVGLMLILLTLLSAALMNLLTKEIATIGGILFTIFFFTLFQLSERYHEKKRTGDHQHKEQFNQQRAEDLTALSQASGNRYRKLVAIRSTFNLFMLEKALAETDPETTTLFIMTAKPVPPDEGEKDAFDLDEYDRQLMTAVVTRAEKAGKQVQPLIVRTNNPLHAVMNTAKDLQAHEVIMGASNKHSADEQLEQIAFYWINLHGGQPAPLTVRVLGRDRDMYLDMGGGNRIPKISERRARSVAELRAAGVGVDRVLLVHDGSPACSDLFQNVLTMLDPEVHLAIVPVTPAGTTLFNGHSQVKQDAEQAERIGRELEVLGPEDHSGPEIVGLAKEKEFDLIVLPLQSEQASAGRYTLDNREQYVLQHAHCRVFVTTHPTIPHEVVDTTPSATA